MQFAEAQLSFMKRALQLAQYGIGHVSPNPMVGCVIVNEGSIIGEGWHKKYGEPHAEVNAVASVVDKSSIAGSDVYVTLEPCAHYGKTPPCAELLVNLKVRNVYVASVDPNPLVKNMGIQKLRDAGIHVVTGVLEKEALVLNRRFFVAMTNNRPYVILKYAKTADGFLARKNYDSKWISHASSRKLVHKWRAEEDAILVGKNTALHDNPKLNVRDWNGKNPIRVLIDHNLALSKLDLHLFNDDIPTLCFNTQYEGKKGHVDFIRLDEEGFLVNLLLILGQKNIQSLIVEGGARTLATFIESGLWDEARIFTATTEFKEGIKAPSIAGELISEENIVGDILSVYQNHHAIEI